MATLAEFTLIEVAVHSYICISNGTNGISDAILFVKSTTSAAVAFFSSASTASPVIVPVIVSPRETLAPRKAKAAVCSAEISIDGLNTQRQVLFTSVSIQVS